MIVLLSHGKKMGILLSMETTATPKQPKRRGPAPKLGRLVDTHIHVDPDLLEWAKQKPEGFAGLMRRLLKQEYERTATS
jgi:hypothetical protein